MRLVQVVIIFLLAFFLTSCKPEDKQPPVITLLGNNPITIKRGEIYIDTGATAMDNVDGAVKVNSEGVVDYAKVGDYLITYKAEDKAGNTSTKTRLVHVIDKEKEDKQPPVITLLGNNPITIKRGEIYIDAGATAMDNVDGAVEVNSEGVVDYAKVGDYLITYIAEDKSGNTAAKTRLVHVINYSKFTFERIKIVEKEYKKNEILFFDFSLKKSYSKFDQVQLFSYISTDTNINDNEFEITGYGIDNHDFINNLFSSSSYVKITVPNQRGTYYTGICARIIWKDSHVIERIKTCTTPIKITVKESEEDKQPPVITLLGNNPITIRQGETYIDAGATAVDDVDGEIKVSKEGAVDYNNIGKYSITYTAKDKAGNVSEKTRIIYVINDNSLKINSIKNKVLNIDYLCRENDEMNIVGSNLQQNSEIRLDFINKNKLVTSVTPSSVLNEMITFHCPKLSDGFSGLYINYGDEKSDLYKIQFISKETPVIEKLSLYNNTLSIEGQNLNQNMNLHINNTIIKIDNKDGDSYFVGNVDMPEDTQSGYVYFKWNSLQSNSKYLIIKKEKNGTIESLNSNLVFDDISIWSQDNIGKVDSSGFFSLKINQERKYDIVYSDIFYKKKGYLSGVVLSNNESITLNSLSTAIAEVWNYLTVDYLSNDELLNLRNSLSSRDDIKKLAYFINTSLKKDILFLDSYPDSLREKVKNIARNIHNDFMNKKKRRLAKFSNSSPAKISPSTYRGISFKELNDGSGNLLIENDTALPLSVKITGTDGSIFLDHIRNIFAYGAIDPQDDLYRASETSLKQPNGRDAKIEVLTAGFFGDVSTSNKSIVNSLRYKLFRDVIWNKIFKGIIGDSYKEVVLKIILNEDLLMHLVHGDINKAYTTLNNSLNGFSFEKIGEFPLDVKSIDKKFLVILKKFDLSYYFNVAYDLSRVKTTVDFEAIFPATINNILPNNISLLDRDVSEFIKFKIKGDKLKKYSPINGGIVQISDANDRYMSDSGVVESINNEGTEIEVKINRHDIQSLYINDRSIKYINVRMNNTYDRSKNTNSIRLEVTNDILLLSVEPKIVKYGNSVTISGYGFDEYRDSLRIHVGTIALSSSDFAIHKGDGSSPDTVTFKLVDGLQKRMKPGSYKVVASGQLSEHYHESNPLNLAVVSNDAPIYIGRANPIIEMGIHKTRFLSNFGLDFSDKETKQENLSLSFKVLKGSDIISVDQNNNILIAEKEGETELAVTATDEDDLFTSQIYKIKVKGITLNMAKPNSGLANDIIVIYGTNFPKGINEIEVALGTPENSKFKPKYYLTILSIDSSIEQLTIQLPKEIKSGSYKLRVKLSDSIAWSNSISFRVKPEKLMMVDTEESKIVRKPWLTQENYEAKKYYDTSGDTASTYCFNLTYWGYDDWRLPTSSELGQFFTIYPDMVTSLGVPSFWTSETNSRRISFGYGADSADTVHLNTGYVSRNGVQKNSVRPVRCVRGGK